MKDLKSAFQMWRSVPATRSYCLPEHGIRIARPGALMLPSMDPAVVFTVQKMRARLGLASTKGCLKVIGDASESTLRQTVNAFTPSSRQKSQVCIAPTTEATPGLWQTQTRVSQAVRGTSTASPSTHKMRT